MKLFSIIETFDKKQRLGFLTYIELYHKSNSVICKVARWLYSQNVWKGNTGEDFSSEDIWAKLPFDIKHQSVSNALATMGNLAQEYLGWMVWKDSPHLKRSCQLQGFAQKSLSDEYIKTQKEVFDDSSYTEISIWENFYKMRTLFEDYNFNISPSDDNHTDRFIKLIKHFKKASSTLAQFILAEMKNRERLLSESWTHEEKYFNLLYNNETDVLSITDRMIKINANDDPLAFEELVGILKSNRIDQYSNYIKYFIASYCIIYVTRKIKQGETYRGQELLDLYAYSLDKGFYMLNDIMSLKQFNNIIGVASKLQNYDWARKSVEEWAHKVDKNNAKTMAIFGHATIDFHQKKYDKVIRALSQMKSSNFQHRFSSRWLYLRAQFELNREYIDVLKTQIDNFRRFIVSNNSKINRQTFEGLNAALKILNMLLDRKEKQQIEDFYHKSKYVFERKWITEKIKNPAG